MIIKFYKHFTIASVLINFVTDYIYFKLKNLNEGTHRQKRKLDNDVQETRQIPVRCKI